MQMHLWIVSLRRKGIGILTHQSEPLVQLALYVATILVEMTSLVGKFFFIPLSVWVVVSAIYR